MVEGSDDNEPTPSRSAFTCVEEEQIVIFSRHRDSGRAASDVGPVFFFPRKVVTGGRGHGDRIRTRCVFFSVMDEG